MISKVFELGISIEVRVIVIERPPFLERGYPEAPTDLLPSPGANPSYMPGPGELTPGQDKYLFLGGPRDPMRSEDGHFSQNNASNSLNFLVLEKVTFDPEIFGPLDVRKYFFVVVKLSSPTSGHISPAMLLSLLLLMN